MMISLFENKKLELVFEVISVSIVNTPIGIYFEIYFVIRLNVNI